MRNFNFDWIYCTEGKEGKILTMFGFIKEVQGKGKNFKFNDMY